MVIISKDSGYNFDNLSSKFDQDFRKNDQSIIQKRKFPHKLSELIYCPHVQTKVSIIARREVVLNYKTVISKMPCLSHSSVLHRMRKIPQNTDKQNGFILIFSLNWFSHSHHQNACASSMRKFPQSLVGKTAEQQGFCTDRISENLNHMSSEKTFGVSQCLLINYKLSVGPAKALHNMLQHCTCNSF